MNYFQDLLRRLRSSSRWIAVQFAGNVLLILMGIAWTRLPEKHVWQVALSLLLPLLLIPAALTLHAGTMRSLAKDEGRRARFTWGASTLLLWLLVGWLSWALLDWFDDQIPQWAGFLNSQLTAHARSRIFTYEHFQIWLTWSEWILRWIAIPGKIIPYAMASATAGWRIPLRRILRLLWSWKYWIVVVPAGAAAAELPAFLFNAAPHGSLNAQIWRVGLKLAISYIVAVTCWVLVLAWAAEIFSRMPEPDKDALDAKIFRRIAASRRWISLVFAWTFLSILVDYFTSRLPNSQTSSGWVVGSIAVVMIVSALILQVGTTRSLMRDEKKRTRPLWGLLAALIWAVLITAIAFLLSIYNVRASLVTLSWWVVPAVFLPFVAASAQWGVILPLRRIFHVLRNWRWWLGVLFAVVIGVAVPKLFTAASFSGMDPAHQWSTTLQVCGAGLLSTSCWILLLSLLAVLLSPDSPAEYEAVPVLASSGPKGGSKRDSVHLPLPDGRDDSTGNA